MRVRVCACVPKVLYWLLITAYKHMVNWQLRRVWCLKYTRYSYAVILGICLAVFLVKSREVQELATIASLTRAFYGLYIKPTNFLSLLLYMFITCLLV